MPDGGVIGLQQIGLKGDNNGIAESKIITIETKSIFSKKSSTTSIYQYLPTFVYILIIIKKRILFKNMNFFQKVQK